MGQRTFRSAVSLAAVLLLACTGSVGSSQSGREGGGSGSGDPAQPGGSSRPGGGGSNPGMETPPPGGGDPTGVRGDETPGHTPMRRLTQLQYNNTIRDLLGLEGDFAGGFAGDEDVAGFLSNGISPVGEAQVEKYHLAAERIAEQAVAAGTGELVPCAATPNAECANTFVRDFGLRAFRRPLTDEEIERYTAVFNAGQTTDGSFNGGVQLVITAMLQSPHFLYLAEPAHPDQKPGTIVPLDGYQIASRLSYFLRASMPDDELFKAAGAGALSSADEVAAHAQRLLGSEEARSAVAAFHRQWLEIQDLSAASKDAEVYPDFNAELRKGMEDEIASFVSQAVLGDEGTLKALLTSRKTAVNAPLAEHYGVTGTGEVELPATERAGLFTLAGVMALYAHPNQSAPVSRGYLVSEKLLCITPPPAPDNVNSELPPPAANVTTRERLERHRTDPSCASCHMLMDPYGLAFEIYDAVGSYRQEDGGRPVDASGTGLPKIGDVQNALDMMAKLAEVDDVRACLTRQWFRFGLGREETKTDDATIAAALEAFGKNDYKLSDLLVGLTTTAGFRYRAPVSQ